MITTSPDALAETRRAVTNLAELESAGWRVTPHATAYMVEQDGAVTHLVDGLRSIAAVAVDARVVGRFGNHSITLVVGEHGQLVTDQSSGDLAEVFAGAELEVAREAWDGDPHAALQLSGSWHVAAPLQLARPLRQAEPAMEWFVVRRLDELIRLIDDTPVWELGVLFAAEKLTIFMVADLPEGAVLNAECLRVLSLSDDLPDALQARSPRGLSIEFALPGLPSAPDPQALAPTLVTSALLQPLADRLWRASAGMCWAALATNVAVRSNPEGMDLEIFGLQRVTHSFGAAGPVLSKAQAVDALDLYRWAMSTGGTDQALAIRQVASLHRDRDDPPWLHSRDIRRAAEPVFLALRSDAVSEAFKAQREARALATTVAQKTAEAAAGLAKGAVERCLASLLAIGGVIVARSSQALSVHQATSLRALVGVFLLALAGWSLFIEGPPVTAPLRALRTDLQTFSDLLSADDRDGVLSLSAVTQAEQQARIARLAVPLAYLGAALTAFLVTG